MHLKWNDYPGINHYKNFEELSLKSSSIRKTVEEVENLENNQVIVLENCKFLPENSREYMKNGPELKISPKKVSPWSHFPEEFKRLKVRSPKRGYKWHNKRNNTSIFVPFSSLFDGLKLYVSRRKDIDAKVYENNSMKRVSGELNSRSENRKYSVFEGIVQKEGEFFSDWLSYNCVCSCKGHLFDRFTSFKYVNPENYVCPHVIAVHNTVMENKENRIYPLFPGPTKKFIDFDENLTRVFVKKDYKKRLSIAHRNKLDSAYFGYMNEDNLKGLSFFRNDAVLEYRALVNKD